MKTFSTLQEYLDYVSTCIVCQKKMLFRLETTTPGSNGYWDFTNIRFEFKDEFLQSMPHKKLATPIIMEPKSNIIISGIEFLKKAVFLSGTQIYARLKCRTCDFKIISATRKASLNTKIENFPSLHLLSEELSFTFSSKLGARMYNHYYDYTSHLPDASVLVVGGMSIPLRFDFGKIKSFSQITHKIRTYLVFQ